MNRFPALFAVSAGIFLSLHAVAVTLGAMADLSGIAHFQSYSRNFTDRTDIQFRERELSLAPFWDFPKGLYIWAYSA